MSSPERLHGTIEHLADRTEQAVHRGIERTEHLAHRAVEKGSAGVSQAKQRLDQVQSRVQKRTQDQPLRALALAASVGALLGALLSRRGRNGRESGRGHSGIH